MASLVRWLSYTLSAGIWPALLLVHISNEYHCEKQRTSWTKRFMSRFRAYFAVITTDSGSDHSQPSYDFGGDRGPKKTFLQSIGRLEGDPPDERKGSPVHTLDDLRAEPHGNEIFFDLCLYPSYRDALISMATYVSGDRLLTESGKLRDIHRVMHGKKEADGKRGSWNETRRQIQEINQHRRRGNKLTVTKVVQKMLELWNRVK
jgi:hypothetical protein